MPAVTVPSDVQAVVSIDPRAGAVPLNVSFVAWAYIGTPPFHYSWDFGDNVTFSSNSSGNVTHVYTSVGQFAPALEVTDATNSWENVSGVYVVVEATPLAVSDISANRLNIDLGQQFQFHVNASGAGGDYNYSWWGLPTGCATANTSTLSCTPTATGSWNLFVCVRDPAYVSRCSNEMTVKVNPRPTLSGVSASLAQIDVNETTHLTVSVSSYGAGTLAYAWSGLPAGCESANTTNLVCTPSVSGLFQVLCTAKDQTGTFSSASTQLTVNPAPSIVSLTASPSTIDVGQTAVLSANTTGGTGWIRFSWSQVPTGCMAANESVLQCAPVNPGNFTIVLSVSDSQGETSSGVHKVTLQVGPRLQQTLHLSAGSVNLRGTVYVNMSVSGGASPYTYTYFGLPPGCASVDSAVLECTPTGAGTFTITGEVVDAAHESEIANVSLTVNSSPTGGIVLSTVDVELTALIAIVAVAVAIGALVMVRRRGRSMR